MFFFPHKSLFSIIFACHACFWFAETVISNTELKKEIDDWIAMTREEHRKKQKSECKRI